MYNTKQCFGIISFMSRNISSFIQYNPQSTSLPQYLSSFCDLILLSFMPQNCSGFLSRWNLIVRLPATRNVCHSVWWPAARCIYGKNLSAASEFPATCRPRPCPGCSSRTLCPAHWSCQGRSAEGMLKRQVRFLLLMLYRTGGMIFFSDGRFKVSTI